MLGQASKTKNAARQQWLHQSADSASGGIDAPFLVPVHFAVPNLVSVLNLGIELLGSYSVQRRLAAPKEDLRVDMVPLPAVVAGNTDKGALSE